MRYLCVSFAAPLLWATTTVQGQDLPAAAAEAIYGNYRIDNDHFLGISRFVTDEGEETVLISDYGSGVVRRLFPVSESEFEMGPGFAEKSPVELRVQVERNADNAVSGLILRPTNGTEVFAEHMPIAETEVRFDSGSAELAGTLMVPDRGGPHPAVILLHGSGPLTRQSFGPYPHFFTSLGFGVLIYDKQGTGSSTGTRLDSSTGAPPSVPDEYFPDRLARDAHAAIAFLRERPEIDPEQIGLWGSSEGGMLTTQVAARDPRVAFAINSSGFMGPLWETTLYQAGNSLRPRGFTEAQIADVKATTRQWVEAARTGQGVEDVLNERAQALRENKGWLVGWTRLEVNTPEELRWFWEHVMSFNSLTLLAQVTCPVLGLFGELDILTDSTAAATNMRNVLTAAEHTDFAVHVIPNAGHSLSEPSRNRMAPEVFPTLRRWLLERIAVR
jgi:pimeloyl-ACP methyl ester carboxylesterase